MTKEKLVSLQRYLDQLTNRMNSLAPEKHRDHPMQFRLFLTREGQIRRS